jgi:nicotinamidase-related amidase
MNKKKIKLLIVDAQNDFLIPGAPLYVNGAEKSVENLITFINTVGGKLDDINETMDCHYRMHIAKPLFWMNSRGEHPNFYDLISEEDTEKNKWMTVIPTLRQWGKDYTKTLKKNGRYQLCIWPPHCIIGSKGNCIYEPLYETFCEWEDKYKGVVTRVSKGSNIKTEHYSAMQADVPDPEDLGTSLNIKLISDLENTDMLLISGWATSHCVKFTVTDIVNNFGKDSLKKIYLLTDCMDSVKGFEKQGDDFLQDMKMKGCNLITTKELLKGGI